jgi:hypothetical protein
MRVNCTSGSVAGAPGNRSLYAGGAEVRSLAASPKWLVFDSGNARIAG